MAGFWSGKRVLVTGGTGFLGSFVVDPRTSHVVPALINKCIDAVDTGASEVTLEQGLRNTIDWYRQRRAETRAAGEQVGGSVPLRQMSANP